MELGYYFPLRNGGIKDGINDAGIETFKGSPVYSLTKETIQNSLDARDDKGQPVRVKFAINNLDKSYIPYINQFEETVNSCKEYWKLTNEKTKKFFTEGLKLLSDDKISILEVSDYNTVGLRGARTEDDSPFTNLVKAAGVSNKDESAGGSFGIGKNAPFACTRLRTIIYSTKDDEGVLALQGVSRLVTHKNTMNKDTKGTGFLGVTSNENDEICCRPFLDEEVVTHINEYFIRDKVGTSVFVIGFDGGDDWKEKIIDATLDYYFVAIVEGNLEVEVDNVLITKDSIKKIMTLRNEIWRDNITYNYFEAITLFDKQDGCYKFENNDFEGMGKITLFLNMKKDLPKKIALVRGAGMKIIDKDRFRLTNGFAGVLRVEGDKINKFIRSLENPSHDKIEPDRLESDGHEKVAYAKEILRRLFEWVKETIKEIEGNDDREEIDVDGVGQYLPDYDSVGQIEIGIKDGQKRTLKKLEVKENKKQKKTSRKYTIPSIEQSEDGIDAESGNRGSNGTGGNEGNGGDKEGAEQNRRGEKVVPISMEKGRVFCIDKNSGKYRLIIKSGNSANTYFQLRIIGEDGYDVAKINNVMDSEGQIIGNDSKLFGPIKFKKGQERIFEITIDKGFKYSMEVVANANHS